MNENQTIINYQTNVIENQIGLLEIKIIII